MTVHDRKWRPKKQRKKKENGTWKTRKGSTFYGFARVRVYVRLWTLVQYIFLLLLLLLPLAKQQREITIFWFLGWARALEHGSVHC